MWCGVSGARCSDSSCAVDSPWPRRRLSWMSAAARARLRVVRTGRGEASTRVEGATRDLAALLVAGERGRSVVADQRYEVRSAIASGDTVAMEIDWSATLRVSVGTLAAGDTMRASFGVFLTFRDGKICSQRNYDCFEPF